MNESSMKSIREEKSKTMCDGNDNGTMTLPSIKSCIQSSNDIFESPELLSKSSTLNCDEESKKLSFITTNNNNPTQEKSLDEFLSKTKARQKRILQMHSKSFREGSVLNKSSIASVCFGSNNSIGDKLRIRRESPSKSMKNISTENSLPEINEDGKENAPYDENRNDIESHRMDDKPNNEGDREFNDGRNVSNTRDNNQISPSKSSSKKKFRNELIKLKLQMVGLDKQEELSFYTDSTAINDLEIRDPPEESYMIGFELELEEGDTAISYKSNDLDSSSEHSSRIQKIKWSKSTISCRKETSQRIRRLSESEKMQLFIERPDLNVRNKFKGRAWVKDDAPKLCGIPFEGVNLHPRRKQRRPQTEGTRPKFYLGKQADESENTFYQKMTSCMSEVPYL